MDGGSLKTKTIPWGRFLAEAVLIVSSVYLAIALEGASTERGRRAEAIEALTALRAELALDQADAKDILALQADQALSHERLQAWFLEPLSIPTDSFSAALVQSLTKNRTMFPRRSSWTTMVAGGQLADLDDPALINRLANLYEHSNVRLEYNGARYDDTTQDMLRVRLPVVWDLIGERFLTSDATAIRMFGNQMLQAQRQNRNYLILLGVWREELDGVLEQVELYLELHGGGA